MNGQSVTVRVLTLIVCSAISISSLTNGIAADKTPALPDANSKILWDFTGAPFDVAGFLEIPKPERNAAPLYLDAFFEFSTDLASCFPKEEQERRSVLTRELFKRYLDIENRLDKNTVVPAEVDALVADYAVGFRKLRKAQERPECVFKTGLTISTVFPHLQGCQQIARIVKLKAPFDIERGKVNRVLSDLEMTLRVADDMRQRGLIINHIVAMSIRSIIYSNVVPKILSAENLEVKHCDRLLKILKRFDGDLANLFLASIKGEYVAIRNLLHDIEHREGEFSVKGRGNLKTVGDVFVDLVGSDNSDSETAKAVTSMNGEDFRVEVNWLDLNYFRIREAQRLTYPKRMRALNDIQRWVDRDTRLLAHLMPANSQAMDAFFRSKTRSVGWQCLTAVRRWQIANPTDQQAPLLRMVRAAGIDGIPQDPYTGKLMHLSWIDEQPVVYSFGPDGRDDHGAVDWKFNVQPGDFLFFIH